MPCSPSARRLNKELQTIIDEQTEPWGIKVSTVEVKDVELPQDMQRAIALQAQAERERRAKIIGAEGEFQAAQKLADAADIISQNPATIQLRYLQTLLQIGVNNTTIVFPLPIELMDAFQRITGGEGKTIVPPPPPSAPAGGPAGRARPVPASTLTADSGTAGEAPGLPEIRIDELTGLRSLLAPGRHDRPRAYASPAAEPAADAAATCPFCEGREDRTPPEVWANRPGGGAPDGPGWLQRSVPNLYPVLTGPDDGRPEPDPRVRPDQRRRPAPQLRPDERAGAVQDRLRPRVPRGDRQLAAARERARRPRRAGLEGAVAAWRTRIAAHADDASFVHLCVNEGADAGSTLPHTHAQLFALPFVPTAVARERERFTAYHERTMGGHLLEDVIVEEVRRRDRLVAIDDEAALFCPWASRSPFELRLVPRTVQPRFDRDERGAELLGRALAGLREVLRRGPADEPLGPLGAARDRGVPLARRHRPPARDQGGLRARHRHRHQLLRTRAGGRRPARGRPEAGLAR